MFYFNTLNLNQVSGGNQVKQGDFGSTFTYNLADEKGRELDVFDQKTAYVNLVLDNNIVFTTTVIVDGSTVSFKIDKAIPIGLYFLEIKIDSYIFPSDRQTIILVNAGAVAYDLKDLVPNYDTNMTITGILSDLSQKGIDISVLDNKQKQTTAQLQQTVKKDDTLSMANMGQDIKEAMTGGSVAVVGRDMVGKENIKKASVTAGKLAFTKRGFNLFDGEYKEGVALNLGTNPMSLTISPGRMTAIIPVEGGKTYHYQGYDDTDRLAIAATKEYPNFSKNIGESLADYDLVKGVNTAKVYRELVVPVDANFLVINVSGDYSEPEVQLSETSWFRTGYDRRINPSNGGAGTVAHVNSHFGINFRYNSNEIIINDLTFVAFGYRYSIPYTTIPMMNGYVNNNLICYNLTTGQLVQYESLNTLKVPDDVVILGSYTKKDVTPISINGFSNYQINDTNVHNRNYAKNGLLVSKKGRLNFDFARGKIITTGNTQVMLNGRSYLIPPQELDISGASTTESSCLYADVSKFDVLLKYDTLYTMRLSPNQIPLGTFFPLDGTVIGIENYLINGVDPKKNAVVGSNFNLKIGGIGQIDADITSADGYELTLASIKSLRRRQPYKDSGSQKITQMPVGYLYHAPSKSGLTDLYYSANQADKPKKIGNMSLGFDFDLSSFQSAIGEDGEIIWVHEQGRNVDGSTLYRPRVHDSGDYSNPKAIDLPVTPISWLQNCGIDFAFDENGNEYCIFGEYTGARYGDLHLWKVTKPYSDPANWKTVLTKTQSTSWAANDRDIWHFHTANYDPYTGVWYATSGDTDAETHWWYSTDEGESWTELLDGTYWESQIARLLNFVFTEDYIYWANDYGTNHSLNRVSRGANGVIDPTTRVKLAELNKNQSTYATILTHSPAGILMLDRVDTRFASNTNTLDVEFWSFDDGKLHTLKTIKRVSDKNSFFGFRCKVYTLYQGIYDARIIVGFGTSPNWLELPHNDAERRTTLTFDIY